MVLKNLSPMCHAADGPRPPVELALLEVPTESHAGVETALDALARVTATTLAESGDYTAARRFYELLEAALMRER
jgi:hypothetical protein